MHTKPQQNTDKVNKHNMRTVFSRISIDSVHLVFYLLSSIHLNSSIFVPTSHFAFTTSFATPDYAPLPSPGPGGKKTASPLTS